MAVVSCELLANGRSIGRDERGRYSYGAQYRVVTDDRMDDAIVVQVEAESAGPDPLPQHMSVYSIGGSADLSAFAQQLGGEQSVENDRKIWIFTVGWQPLPPGKSPTETQTAFDNPLLRPQRYWTEFQTYGKVLEKDYQGNPIVNGAGQPFDESAHEDDEYEVLIWEKNFATAGEIRVLNRTYRRKLNTTAFAGYPPLHCLCMPIRTSRPEYSNGVTFYKGTIRVVCRDEPWVRQFVNRGFKHFVNEEEPAGSGTMVKKLVTATDPTLDEDGNVDESKRTVVTEPVLLTDSTAADGAGFRLPQDTAGNVLEFQTRGIAELNSLPITVPA